MEKDLIEKETQLAHLHLFGSLPKGDNAVYQIDGLPYYDITYENKEERIRDLEAEIEGLRKRLGYKRIRLHAIVDNSTYPKDVNEISKRGNVYDVSHGGALKGFRYEAGFSGASQSGSGNGTDLRSRVKKKFHPYHPKFVNSYGYNSNINVNPLMNPINNRSKASSSSGIQKDSAQALSTNQMKESTIKPPKPSPVKPTPNVMPPINLTPATKNPHPYSKPRNLKPSNPSNPQNHASSLEEE